MSPREVEEVCMNGEGLAVKERDAKRYRLLEGVLEGGVALRAVAEAIDVSYRHAKLVGDRQPDLVAATAGALMHRVARRGGGAVAEIPGPGDEGAVRILGRGAQ